MPHLDRAIALASDTDGRWRAHADPDHESISAMFGGWTAAVGAGYILNEATGTRGVHSTSGQQARLWSRESVLLATTEQLCWYR